MNRHERRRMEAELRVSLKSAKKRCLACEQAPKQITKEHLFPQWLIGHAEATTETIDWVGQKVLPSSVHVPLCEKCNSGFGSLLEQPMSELLPRVSAGGGLTDPECELLVRWLWKFEGLVWGLQHFHDDAIHYTATRRLRERVTSPLDGIRPRLVVALALANRNDIGSHDWSLGLSSPPIERDAIFGSAVFRNVAMMVSLDLFADLIPPMFTKYQLSAVPINDGAIVMTPNTVFPFVSDAEIVTRDASLPLKAAHEAYAAKIQAILPVPPKRSRIVVPRPSNAG